MIEAITLALRASTFLAELKRRKVFRVAVVYIVVGLAILGAAESILDPLGLGDARPFIVILTLLGLPIALVLAWAYEVRPEKSAPATTPEEEGDPARGGVASGETAAADEGKSIVVLPFVNMSADPENEFFSDGMTEEIINALTQLSDLHVVARTSSFAFKGKTTSIDEIGRKLNVTTVLEGSVRKAANRLRITAQLINVADGFHLWSEKYDREADDVFAIQDEISLAIVDKLRVRLIPGEKARLAGKATLNPAAHEAYLKGRYFWNQRGTGVSKAIDFFHAALAEDENYALAHAGLADAYASLGFYGYLPPREVMPKARDAAQKALAIDDGLVEAHSSLGFVLTVFDWDWEGARKEFLRAFELNPSYGPARYWYTNLLLIQGQLEEAIAEVELGLKHDPLSMYMQTFLGIVLLAGKKYAQAAEQLRKTLELDPTFFIARSTLGLTYANQSRVEDGIAEIQEAIARSDRDQLPVTALGMVYAAAGDRRRAREVLTELEQRARDGYISAINIAAIHAQLGDKNKALEWLEKAYEERSPMLFAVEYGYFGQPFDSLKTDPRFVDLLRRMGLRE